MECLHSVAVLCIWIETTLQHRFESFRIAAFGRSVHHQVVLLAKLVAQIRMLLEQRACLRLIAESTRRNKTVDPREFVFRAMSQQPGRHLVIPVQRGERMRRASIGPPLIYLRSVGDQQLHGLNVQSWSRKGGRPPARLSPCKVRIGSVLQYPFRSGNVARSHPTQNVRKRGNASWNSVNIDAESIQQFQRRNISTARRNVRGNAVRRICTALEQQLCKLRLPRSNQSSPESCPW